MEYRQKLVEQWKTESNVRKVADSRHLPQSVHSATKLKREMLEARKVKEDRRRKHTKAGREKPKPERKSEYLHSRRVNVRLGRRSRGSRVARMRAVRRRRHG